MAVNRVLLVALLVCLVGLNSVSAIKCRLCWPPQNEDECKRSEQTIDCLHWESVGYDSCIEVKHKANGTIARTCYVGTKCSAAEKWCKRNGPCVARCCIDNLCNSTQINTLSQFLLATFVTLATVMVLL